MTRERYSECEPKLLRFEVQFERSTWIDITFDELKNPSTSGVKAALERFVAKRHIKGI